MTKNEQPAHAKSRHTVRAGCAALLGLMISLAQAPALAQGYGPGPVAKEPKRTGMSSSNTAAATPSAKTLIELIAQRDLNGVQRELDNGAFVGTNEVRAAIRAGHPDIYQRIVDQAVTKPQLNNCEAILDWQGWDRDGGHRMPVQPFHAAWEGSFEELRLNEQWVNERRSNEQRLRLLRALVGEGAPNHCDGWANLIFDGLYRSGLASIDDLRGAIEATKLLVQKRLLAPAQNVSTNYRRGLSRRPKVLERAVDEAVERLRAGGGWVFQVSLALALIEAAPSTADYDPALLEQLATSGTLGRVANAPEHLARLDLMERLSAKGLRLSSARTSAVLEATSKDARSSQRREVVALLERLNPNLEADQRLLKANTELVAALNNRDDPDRIARVAHLIRRGANPNAVRVGDVPGFNSYRDGVVYGDNCKSLTHRLIDLNSLEVAKALVEKTRDELINGVRTKAAGKCGEQIQFYLIEQVMASTADGGNAEAVSVYLLEQGLPLMDPVGVLTGAARRGYRQLAQDLLAKGVSLDAAFRSVAARNDDKAMALLADVGGKPGATLLANHQREQAEKRKREAVVAEQKVQARAKQEAQENARMAQLRAQRKNIGDRVCMQGEVSGFLTSSTVRIKAFVEGVSGQRIQLRVAHVSGGMPPNYGGVTLDEGRLIWDDYDNWFACD